MKISIFLHQTYCIDFCDTLFTSSQMTIFLYFCFAQIVIYDCDSAGSNAVVKCSVLFVFIDLRQAGLCVYTMDFVSGHKQIN